MKVYIVESTNGYDPMVKIDRNDLDEHPASFRYVTLTREKADAAAAKVISSYLYDDDPDTAVDVPPNGWRSFLVAFQTESGMEPDDEDWFNVVVLELEVSE